MSRTLVTLLVGVLGGFALGWALHRPAPVPVQEPEECAAPGPDLGTSQVGLGLGLGPDLILDDAGRRLVEYLDTGEPAHLQDALGVLGQAQPASTFGTEVWALEWLARHLLLPEEERARALQDPEAARFWRYVSAEDFATLRSYLAGDRATDVVGLQGEARVVGEVLRFSNPLRARREGMDRLLDELSVAPGMVVADVGCGPGLLSFRMADRVGAQGKVYAVDVDRALIEHVEGIVADEKLANVVPRQSRFTDAGLPEGELDLIVLYLTYQLPYAASPAPDRVAFVGSLRRALKPTGRLVVVESDPDAPFELRYVGLSLSPALVSGQLQTLGFRQVDLLRLVPQRYALVMEPVERP